MADVLTLSDKVRERPLAELADIYREHFAFVWRALLRLGVPPSCAEDAAQAVFLVVRRRLHDFERGKSMRAWLFGIARRVAHDHRRKAERERKRLDLMPAAEPPSWPDDDVSLREAAQVVQGFLDGLDQGRRLVFVLSELEGMSGTEIAEALDMNRNTVYSRLRASRRAFEALVARRRADTPTEAT